MAIADSSGLPLVLHVASATPHEVTLVKKTIQGRFLVQLPERIIEDKAYDSDTLDEELALVGVRMIPPHKANRTRTKNQDERTLRRYRKRWKIERLFAWLQNYRRINVRWERHIQNFLAMVQLRCILILLKAFRG